MGGLCLKMLNVALGTDGAFHVKLCVKLFAASSGCMPCIELLNWLMCVQFVIPRLLGFDEHFAGECHGAGWQTLHSLHSA